MRRAFFLVTIEGAAVKPTAYLMLMSLACGLAACGAPSATTVLPHGRAPSLTTVVSPPDPGCPASSPSCNSVPTVPTNPGTGACTSDPSACATPRPTPSAVAVAPGKPSGSCTQTDGSNSLPVGATLGSVNKNGVADPRNVVDVNQVNAIASTTIVNNQTVVTNYTSVGWLYLDNNGGRWFQKDPAAQWTVAINVNVNKYFGFSLTGPTAQNPVYVSNPPQAAPITDSLSTTKCWSQGSSLVPGPWA
jgi:hypothetical protein